MKRVFSSALLILFVAPIFAAAEVIEKELLPEEGKVVVEEATDEQDELVRFSVRTEEGIVAQEALVLATTAEPVLITPTAGGEAKEVDPRSMLALLVALDEVSEAFTITDLQYFSGFGAFFLNCIEVSEDRCGNWQYTVNGTYPPIGMDSYILADDDEVYVFYGSPRIVTLASSTVFVDIPFSATIGQYDPALGEYTPLEGLTLGVVMEDPNDPWTPIEVLTASTDVTGSATFTVATSGEYGIGIKEDYYYPRTPLSVIPVETGGSLVPDDETSPSGIVGGGGTLIESTRFDVAGACAFIARQQGIDGSFGAPLYTDWAGIALAVCDDEVEARRAVRSYLSTDADSYERVTDYERRAMVLMALGIDPYTGTGTNLIDSITASFDGSQIGDPLFINDDIFALIVFARAAPAEEDLLFSVLAHVLAQQSGDGSWLGGVDMTAAAIQALTPFSDVPGVEEALAVAVEYLRSQQGSEGGFGNVFSTAWVLQALAALGASPSEWSVSGNDPYTYLTASQQADGGVETGGSIEDRLWATSYAVLGAGGQAWYDVMQSFAPKEQQTNRGVPAPTGVVASAEDTAEDEYEEIAKQGIESVASVGGSSDEGLPIEAIRALIAYADSLRESPSTPPSSRTMVANAEVFEPTHEVVEGQVRTSEDTVPATDTSHEGADVGDESEAEQTEPATTTEEEGGPAEGAPIGHYVLIALVAFLVGITVGTYVRRR